MPASMALLGGAQETDAAKSLSVALWPSPDPLALVIVKLPELQRSQIDTRRRECPRSA